MELVNWFSTFCSNIQVNNNEIITTHFKNITQRLNIDFQDSISDTANSLFVGSYGRNTAINGFSVVDMIFVLPYSNYKKYNKYKDNGQSALLQEVKKSIETRYPDAVSLHNDGQAVVVTLSDGMTFLVTPAFVNNDDDSYTIPNSNEGGSWKTINPKPEIKAVRERNINCKYNLIPLCRMMRSWKNKWNVPISGLLIDTLVYQFINGWEYNDQSYIYYDYMCRDFFELMANQDPDKLYWQAPGSNQCVYNTEKFQHIAKQCYNLSLEAIEYQKAEPINEEAAKQKWREIFGSEFPN